MAKKKGTARKSNGAAGIETVDDNEQPGSRMPIEEVSDASSEDVSHPQSNGKATKATRKPKAKPAAQASGGVGVAEIRKAATFANSVGGIDQAIALLQILKVAKEM